MVLAFASEGCTVSGEVFNTARWAAGRNVWGVQRGKNGLWTTEECLEKMGEITKRGREVFEPQSMVDLTEYQASYMLENDYKL